MNEGAVLAVLDGAEGGRRLRLAQRVTLGRGDEAGFVIDDPEISRRHVHLCGPPPMMDAVKPELAELGVPKDQVETEAIGPAEGMAPADSLETTYPAEAASPGDHAE